MKSRTLLFAPALSNVRTLAEDIRTIIDLDYPKSQPSYDYRCPRCGTMIRKTAQRIGSLPCMAMKRGTRCGTQMLQV